jgi:hypothetical protein
VRLHEEAAQVGSGLLLELAQAEYVQAAAGFVGGVGGQFDVFDEQAAEGVGGVDRAFEVGPRDAGFAEVLRVTADG